MDILNYVIPTRPDGGSWSNVHDMLAYVRMELAKGHLPDGSRYIGQDALLARYEQQVATGSDSGYGMGLKIDRTWGIPVINHGGTESGYRSDMVWLPEHGVGAVILPMRMKAWRYATRSAGAWLNCCSTESRKRKRILRYKPSASMRRSPQSASG